MFLPPLFTKELIMQNESDIVKQTVGTAFDMWQKFALRCPGCVL